MHTQTIATVILTALSVIQPAVAAPRQTPHFQWLTLYHHNIHRANHSAPPLVWDQQLAQKAEAFVSKCSYYWDSSLCEDIGGCGGNRGAGIEHLSDMITGEFYNYGFGCQFGMMTQVVWKSSTKVACAMADCDNIEGFDNFSAANRRLSVCLYSPAGNTAAAYAANVLPPLGHPVVHGQSY